MRYLMVAMLFLFTAATPALADSERENVILGRLLGELETLRAMADQAQQHADAGQRINFNYNALRADIHTLQLGIEQYRAGIRNQPRTIPAIVGDYRR